MRPDECRCFPCVDGLRGCNITSRSVFFASTSYSQSRLFTKDCYAHFNETQYKKGQYLVANVFWNVTHNFQVGVEYLHGWREDFNDLSREANRINLSAQYNF